MSNKVKVNDIKPCNASSVQLRNLSRKHVAVKKTRHKLILDTGICCQYSIIIKPKLNRSSSLTDLSNTKSELNWEDLSQSHPLLQSNHDHYCFNASGDSESDHNRRKRQSKKSQKNCKKKRNMEQETYGNKFATEYLNESQPYGETTTTTTSGTENTSDSTLGDGVGQQKFPFKKTPSGCLKVQTNQVVFQSPIVGVLLADPTQAKVQVKIEGNSDDSEVPRINDTEGSEAQLHPQSAIQNMQVRCQCSKNRNPGQREDKGKDLYSLGYARPEPVDWMRVQLPKKADLCHEFFKRVHNFINTDTVIHIGDNDFHCHRMVLQIYSGFFDIDGSPAEVELPENTVTPEAFQSIYEWMILGAPESNKVMKRENILDLFTAAQYLSIKDLEEQCWSFIVNDALFNEDSAFALYRQARQRGITPVMDIMIPRIMRFFLPLVASRDFLELEPIEIVTLLRSNYICVTSEIEVLMAAIRWLYGDWPARREYALELMKCVRFGLISPWQLVDIKRNPDNSEILEIVNEPEIQQMVDDGLAFVIIKYWYGNNSKDYYHWIDVLGLTEPAERNWIGEEKNHVTYKDFLKYLEQFMVTKDQMFQQMAMMQPTRRNEDMQGPGSPRNMRGDDGRPKLDLPLPLLKGLVGDKMPTMSEFMDSRKKDFRPPGRPSMEAESSNYPRRSTLMEADTQANMDIRARLPHRDGHNVHYKSSVNPIHMCTVEQDVQFSKPYKRADIHDPPEKDSAEDFITTNSDTSSESADTSYSEKVEYGGGGRGGGCDSVDVSRKRTDSVAACYFANAANGENTQSRIHAKASLANGGKVENVPKVQSPNISLFNESREKVAKLNMNKISNSVLGPSNRNYLTDESLFSWERETVLVFGGVDPHNPYGAGKNTGKDINRFDPLLNTWDNVGELPEPRHHHSVAFLRGRVYLVGGADPRDDDQRGKSVVVSTVWSYEPVTRSWYSENGLQTPRKNFGLVVHRMALYAIGGQDKKGRVLRSVEKFDPKIGTWVEVKPMAVPRMAVAATKYREYIWVAGGMTGDKKKPLSVVVECYNSKTNEWTEIKSLRFPRCFATLFAMSDKLYLIGGAGRFSDKDNTASSVGTIDVWDWKDREWKELTEMSIPRHGHALAYLGTQLIIIGGVTTIYMRALNNVESFCCERGAWIRGVASLPNPLSGHGAVTLPPASLM